jgi:hypothetical protein
MMEKTNDFEEQGFNLAHYAFSKKDLKPTVYYVETLDCTLVFDNKSFYCFEGSDISIEVFVLTKEHDRFGLFSEDTLAACEPFLDYVISACECDLSKVKVHTLDFDDEPLSNLMSIEDWN